MKILTWNINGIRATSRNHSLGNLLDSLEADIICLQETKITRNLLTDHLANVEGYYAFFSFSKRKTGYSGVATFCKKTLCPIAAEEGLTGLFTSKMEQVVGFYNNPPEYSDELLRSLDSEGRCMITEHSTSDGQRLCIINVYCPRADVEEKERFHYKMCFYKLLQMRIISLMREKRNIIVVGDLNVSHKRIDSCDPCEGFEDSPARKWLNSIIDCSIVKSLVSTTSSINQRNDTLVNDENLKVKNSESFSEENFNNFLVDTFRIFHPNQQNAYTCWNTQTRARETNFGTRIDFILADHQLCTVLTNCVILADVQGSDHCPVVADFNILLKANILIPKTCAAFMPEIFGKQSDIKSFFSSKRFESDREGIKRKLNDPIESRFYKKKKIVDQDFSIIKYFKASDTENHSRSSHVEMSNFQSLTEEISCSRLSNLELSHNLSSSNFAYIIDNSNMNYAVKEASSFESAVLYEGSMKQKTENINKEIWKNILKGPESTPLCHGHKEKAVLRTVKKQGSNFGRQFYACSKPVGSSSNKNADCGFFVWKT
ncbi:DNA-(apurinic or apyrimidinic site) endonuclease 2 [Hydra vulgaris]|uniref:DNA-(apurinic or apyrimidinic site) endonuclease n=1 Tax=Hydra vulgaris TaxID=6087 RepID=A0ABM4CYX3_HYDVU